MKAILGVLPKGLPGRMGAIDALHRSSSSGISLGNETSYLVLLITLLSGIAL
jgi:hypothetical protein